MATQANSYSPSRNTGSCILGVGEGLEQLLNLTPANDVNGSLNRTLSVFPDQAPSNRTYLCYFGIGNGGEYNTSTSNGSQAEQVKRTNMGLYNQLPFRLVHQDEDLTADERANYAMRAPYRHTNGDLYWGYYLKKIILNSTSVIYAQKDASTGNRVPFALNYDNLKPTPPATPINGASTDIGSDILAYVPITLPVTGAEVREVCAVLYDNDFSRAKVSELGLYRASPELVQGTNADGTTFPYTEAILATLLTQSCFQGQPFTGASSIWDPVYNVTASDLLSST